MGFFSDLFGGDSLELPNPPDFYEDSNFSSGLNDIFSESTRLRNLDFSGNPLMQETIDLDPEVTNLALQYAQNSLNPTFSRNRQNTINELANLGALESSTTADALARSDYDLNSQLQAITAQAALGDRERALTNRMGLFGTGLNLLNSGTNFGLQNQGMRNQFNMSNYENQVAKVLAEQEDKGGLSGALTGAIGGGLSGFMMGDPMGAAVGAGLGGVSGYMGPSGTGGQIMNASSMMFGSGGFGGGLKPSYTPGSTAGAGNLLAKQPSYANSGFSMSSGFNSLYM